MLTAKQVAEYFLAQIDPDIGEIISNLKLQKLCYYAQGVHLACFDKPLFPEAIKAWTHGPVVPTLYHEYKEYGSGAIPQPMNFDISHYTDEQREFLDEIFSVFGQYSAWKLRNMTHSEPPWINASEAEDNVITHSSMKEYFKQLVE